MDHPASNEVGPAPALPDRFFIDNRERFLDRLAATGGAAVVSAGPELVRSRDTEIRYRPHPDLFYLTGWEEPGTVAVLVPSETGARYVLFVRPRDAEREAWSGRRHGVEGALERFGADEAHPLDELDRRLPELLRDAERVYYPVGADAGLDRRILGIVAAARKARQRSGRGPAAMEDLEPLLGEQRLRKRTEEIERTRVAARIAERAHRAAMERARPGVGEWEIEAVVDGTMREAGAAGPAFPSIVGSGANATILHYTANERRAEDGDLLLVDAGAEWGMYCSDITRTFPVNGRFTEAQREVYDVVLAAEEAGIAAAVPGGEAAEVHRAAVRVLVEGLLRLGLVEGDDVEAAVQDGAYRRFYMHQTSHWIGLDVHDVGPYREDGESLRLEPGMILTVEPGLYLPDVDDLPERYRGIGVRIEDTVLVGEDGPEPLTRGVPVDPEEIERIVGR